MAAETGAFLVGSNVVLQGAATTGRVLLGSPIQESVVKSQTTFASSESRTFVVAGTSTSATPTTLLSIPCAEGEIVVARCTFAVRLSDNTAGGMHTMLGGGFRAAAGNITTVGAASIVTVEGITGSPVPNVNLNTTTQALEIQYTGVAATTLYVLASVEVLRHSLTA